MKLVSWLKLLRLPNLFSVPGDPLAGCMLVVAYGGLAEPSAIVFAVLASLCLYASGLVLNDILDRKEDGRERPDRPIPSGGVPVVAAKVVFPLLAFTGIGLGFAAGTFAGITASVIFLLVVLYNGGLKRQRTLGPVTMGLCRGCSLLLGAMAAGMEWQGIRPVWIAVIGLTAYIAGMSVIARHETSRHDPGLWRWSPMLAVAGTVSGIGICLCIADNSRLPGMWMYFGMGILALVWTHRVGLGLEGECEPKQIAKSIGMYIRGLILFQACLILLVPIPGLYIAAGLLGGLAVSIWLRRWFYAS